MICLSHGMAQELPPISNFSPAQYQAQNQNWMIAQSDDRRMYFANGAGLLEYNGEQWTVYPTYNESIMRSVAWYEDRLYSGAYMDFGFWESQPDGSLKYTSLVETLEVDILEDEQFWNLIPNGSTLLVQSLDRLYSYDPDSKTVEVILQNPALTKVFKVGNRVFYNIANDGLYEIVDGASILVHGLSQDDGNVITMAVQDDIIVFITSANSLFHIEEREVTLISKNQVDKDIVIYSATILSDGRIAAGTIDSGLFFIEKDGSIEMQLNQRNGLSNNTILSMYEDLDGNLWLGLDNGIDYVNINARFTTFIDRVGELGTVYDAFVKDDQTYLGTNQGLYLRDARDNAFKLIEGTQGQVWNLVEIDGTLFCGHNKGTFNISKDQATQIASINGSWDIQKIPGQDNLLLQGNYDGLYVLERIGSSWKVRNKITGFDVSSKDFAVRDNVVYVSHEYKGLFEITLDADFNKATNVELKDEVGKGTYSDLIKLKNRLIYANKNGFYVKEPDTDTFEKDEQLSALVDEDEYTSGRMISMDDQSFWFFMKNQLVQVTVEPIKNTFEFERYAIPQEIRAEKTGYESLFKLTDYQYLMGSSQGYIIFDTARLEDKQSLVYIDKILVTYNDNRLERIDIQNGFELPHDASKLEVNYHTPLYDALTDVKYQYRLKDDMDQWSVSAAASTLIFENLEDDNYQLEVRSVVNGVVGSTARIEFEILPPIYRTMAAYIIYILLAILLIVLINVFYKWYYNKKQEAELTKKQRELDLERLKNQKELAEVNNKQLTTDIESRNRELAMTTMAMIKKNETLSEIKKALEKVQANNDSKNLKAVKDLVHKNMTERQDWKTFEQAFTMTDKAFIKNIKARHPSLTSGDLRLSIYIRLNLSSKEIAPLLNISPRSVEIKRYRLRKKMELDKETDLFEYLVAI
ncbi:ligand-binding sensor domain-containing protein [Nonlabens ponticola]|nr:LuxR C-terminal-related transcriptional regulator [Nonlabens ponticola]